MEFVTLLVVVWLWIFCRLLRVCYWQINSDNLELAVVPNDNYAFRCHLAILANAEIIRQSTALLILLQNDAFSLVAICFLVMLGLLCYQFLFYNRLVGSRFCCIFMWTPVPFQA